MEIARIRGEVRTPGGRHANERLRRRGLVPAVIYGHGQTNEYVAVLQHDLELALHRMAHVVRLETDGRQGQYLIREVQFDHLNEKPIHVDLMRVDPSERVHVRVPLELKGEPRGIHEGGELIQVITNLEIECPLMAIPDVIHQSVKHLELNQALHVRDLELPAGVHARHAPEDMVALVRPRRGVEAAEEEKVAEAETQAAGEPEVIGKGPKEAGEKDEGGE